MKDSVSDNSEPCVAAQINTILNDSTTHSPHTSAIKVASLLRSVLPENVLDILGDTKKQDNTWLQSIQSKLGGQQVLGKKLSDIFAQIGLAEKGKQETLLDRALYEFREILLKVEDFDPALVAGFILTTILAIRLFMSWYSRFPSWSASPFGRGSPQKDGEVSDSDFSYITEEDLAKQAAASSRQNGSTRQTDVIIMRHGRVSYPVHFAAGSIDRGALKIGEIRTAAAKKLKSQGIMDVDPERIKILHRGRNLKDDYKTAREEGFKSSAESEIMLVVGEAPPKDDSSSSGDEDEGEQGVSGEGKKKKRTRKRKSKKKKGGDSGTATPTSSYTNANIDPDATYAPAAAPPRPTPSPRPQVVPQTAIEKLQALSSTFHTKYVPECVQYISKPPSDKAKREYDHKRLSETILAQILLKLDAVETEGNPEARQKRKDLVKEVQGMLNQLDEVVKG